MPLTLVRRPRSAKVQHGIIKEEVRKAYKKLAADTIATLKSDIDNWEHQPEFRSRVAVGDKLWYISVSYDTETESGKIYTWVDKGTGENAGRGGRYPIVPVEAMALSFYVPTPIKTTPGVGGIPGKVLSSGIGSQEHIITKKVMHPGIRPRNFTKSLRTDLKQRAKIGGFRSVTEAAIKRGIHKIGVYAK